MPNVAVIQFPGSNCEYETQRALQAAKLDAQVINWNSDPKQFEGFQAYILPGGFSYQDRVRSGAIAAKLPLMDILKKANLEGKPILGICNGCQILAEAGLLPNANKDFKSEVALAPNHKNGESLGFICKWVHIQFRHPKKNIFTQLFSEEDILPIPINHGEGNFQLSTSSLELLPELAAAYYCHENPNGSTANLAGLSNKAGTLFAMMPHPERASFMSQIPFDFDQKWSDKKRKSILSQEGPFMKLFYGLASHLQ